MNYRITGGKKLAGTVTTNTSKNAAVALLAASLLNKGATTLKRMPKIEEVFRLIEVLQSIGVSVVWQESDVIITPSTINLANINRLSAERTRSIAMFVGPLAHIFDEFDLPAPTGCDLGKRSLGSHIDALATIQKSALQRVFVYVVRAHSDVSAVAEAARRGRGKSVATATDLSVTAETETTWPMPGCFDVCNLVLAE